MINVKLWSLGCLAALFVGQASAENNYKYRVNLKDKVGSAYSVDKPQEFLSERALERRNRQQLPVDETDLPVSQVYVKELLGTGARLVTTSKWNNTVVLEVSDTTLMDKVKEMPFVTHVKKVWTQPDSIPARNKKRKKEVTNEVKETGYYYGKAFRQINIHGGDSLHAAGFAGQGMHVAIIDAGFYNADKIKFFKKMDLLGTRDFVNPKSDIYEENSHGMKVLSCMAANIKDVFVGTAPEASYWLLRSEDQDTEQPVEEDYWAAAIEFADSVGVDVVNTSLGYHEFDEGYPAYRYRDLDGHYSLMSHSASMAADKGMVVVCSAGNSGRGAWKKITPPGDSENVITVGALTKDLVNAEFSSVGDTSDGRVKPDVAAIGVNSVVSGNDGTVSKANGTSFASPTMCGVVTCFWQACPWLTAKEVVKAVQQAGDRVDYPDNIYGYGVPNLWKAYQKELEKKK
ncbi:MAG: S8 family serine peptidase [Bacteroides sp.]|nr:S8 family serine peptidase [Bacteroides sp.]